MPTLVLNTGFEFGGRGQGAGYDGPWQNEVGDDTRVSFPTAHARNGNYALRLQPAAAELNRRISWPGAATRRGVGRIAVKLVSLPAASSDVLVLNSAGPAWALRYNQASGYWAINNGPTGATQDSSVLAVADTYILLEWDLNTSANPHTLAWRIDGTAQPALSYASSAADLQQLYLGCRAAQTPTYDCCYDDLALSNTGADYPIGDGKGLPILSPTGFGTHSNPGDFTGTASPPASTDWGLIDDVPFAGLADYIYQDTIGVGSYLEITFADLVSTLPINGVQAIVEVQRAAAGAAWYELRIRDGTTETVVMALSVDTVTADQFWKQVTPAAAPWTQAAVNGLIGRFGYASDVTPFPRYHAMGLEVDVSLAESYWEELGVGELW